MKFRLAFFTDSHYTLSPPECRGESYPAEVMAKLDRVFQVAKAAKASAILTAGDLFHRRGRTTSQEVNDMLSLFSAWGVQGLPLVGVLGNHDWPNGLDEPGQRASSALPRSGVLHLLDQHRWPFGREQDQEVIVTGTSYFPGNDANDENRIRAYGIPEDSVPSKAVRIHLAHGALVLRGGFPAEHTQVEHLLPLLAEANRLPDVILCGHLHNREEPYEATVNGRRVVVLRPGSLARVSRDDLDRTPVALVLTIQGGRVTWKEVPIGKPVAEAPPREPGDPRSSEERTERIQGFAANLREQAEVEEAIDDVPLLTAAAKDMGHGSEVLERAVSAVRGRK